MIKKIIAKTLLLLPLSLVRDSPDDKILVALRVSTIVPTLYRTNHLPRLGSLVRVDAPRVPVADDSDPLEEKTEPVYA